MNLDDLPQFTISDMQFNEGGWVLDGRFNHLTKVREERSWLYISRMDSLLGDLKALDCDTRQARFHARNPEPPPEWILGATLPWFDGYWDPYNIALILDETHPWKQVTFIAQDGLQSRLPGWNVTRNAIRATPHPNEILLPGAWNHEHCMLCWTHIDPGDAAYADSENHWLCAECFTTYAAPHDISFVRDGI